jgi:hypothetical protein
MVYRSDLEVLEKRISLIPFGIETRRLVLAQTALPQVSGANIAFLLIRPRVRHVGITYCRKCESTALQQSNSRINFGKNLSNVSKV